MKKLIFLFLMQAFIISCKREEPITEHTYHYLDASYLAISPYFNNPEIDTLEFVSNTGDTQIFVKTHVDTTWYVVDGSKAEGPTYLSHYEQRRANFKCIKGDGYLQVLLAEGYPRQLQCMLIDWKQDQYIYYFSKIFDTINNYTYFPKMTWNGYDYLNVNRMRTYLDFSTQRKLYHAKKEGIFLIQDSISNIHYTLNN